jgi:ribosome-associated translation inhibitor RaiA
MAAQDEDLQLPLDIAFHGMDSSDHLRHQVLKQARKLERFAKHITGVRVVLEAQHKQTSKSALHVKVEVSVPGKMLVGQKEGRPHESLQHADIYSVITEAFEVAHRRVEEYIDKHFDHHHKQQHPAAGQPRGTVTRVDTERGHGMLETETGQSLFFQDMAVKGGTLADLEPGMEVTYALAEAEGAYGPEAREVTRVVGGKTE